MIIYRIVKYWSCSFAGEMGRYEHKLDALKECKRLNDSETRDGIVYEVKPVPTGFVISK